MEAAVTDMTLDRPVHRAETPSWARAAWSWLTHSWGHVALLAGIPATSYAHWVLAVIIGYPPALAWTLPVAIDAYVLAAFLAWRQAPDGRRHDLAWALVLDGVAVAGSHAAALLESAMTPWMKAVIAAAFGVVQVAILWRVHALELRVKASRPRAKPTTVVVSQADANTSSPKLASSVPVTPRRQRATVGGDVVSLLQARRDAGVSRAAATAEVAEATGRSLRTVQRHAVSVWGVAA